MARRKVTVQMEVIDANAEGPCEWFPRLPKESALIMVDEMIRRAEGSLQSLREVRENIATAYEYPAAPEPSKAEDT